MQKRETKNKKGDGPSVMVKVNKKVVVDTKENKK